MAATNMTTQNKDITSMVAGLDGKYRPHDLALKDAAIWPKILKKPF